MFSATVPSSNAEIGSVVFSTRTKTDNTLRTFNAKSGAVTVTIDDDFGGWFWISVLKEKTVNIDVGLQLEKSSTATSWTPYENICPISGWSEANVTRTGENLLDLSSLRGGSFDAPRSFPTNNITTDNYVPIKGGRTYIWSQKTHSERGCKYVRWYDNVGNQVGSQNIYSKNPTTIAAPSSATHAKFMWYQPSSFNSVQDIVDMEPQIEPGATASVYETYRGVAVTIDLDGTRYGGMLNVLTGVLRVDMACITADGSPDENWAKYGTQTASWVRQTWRCTSLMTKRIADRSSSLAGCITNGAIIMDSSSETTDGSRITFRSTAYTSSNLYIFTPLSLNYERSDILNMLSQTPLEFCYPLATPFDVQLTPAQLRAIKGQNNIFADCGDVAVKYWKH